MKRRARICYSEAQNAMMWDRWQRGESLHDIAQLFDRGHSSIQRILSETDGIRPAHRVRSRWALSLSEYLAQKQPVTNYRIVCNVSREQTICTTT